MSTFHSTYKFLAAFLETTFTLFHAVPSHSVKCGDVAAELVDRMESRFRQRPLVARKILHNQNRSAAEGFFFFLTADSDVYLHSKAMLLC